MSVFLLVSWYPCCLVSLSNDEWDKRHKASPLDCFGNLTLVLTTDSCVATCLHATKRVDELLQHLGVLIVDEFDLVLGEITLHMICLKWDIFWVDSFALSLWVLDAVHLRLLCTAA